MLHGICPFVNHQFRQPSRSIARLLRLASEAVLILASVSMYATMGLRSGLIFSGLGLGSLYLADLVPSLLRALPTLGLSLIREDVVCALGSLTGAAATTYVGWQSISGIARWPAGRDSGSGQHFIDAYGSPNFTR